MKDKMQSLETKIEKVLTISNDQLFERFGDRRYQIMISCSQEDNLIVVEAVHGTCPDWTETISSHEDLETAVDEALASFGL